MLLTDASIVQLHELEQAIVTKAASCENSAKHLLLELSPESFMQWSSESPVGLILALSIVLQAFRGTRREKYSTSVEFLRFLRKSLLALRFMEEEIKVCIEQLE